MSRVPSRGDRGGRGSGNRGGGRSDGRGGGGGRFEGRGGGGGGGGRFEGRGGGRGGGGRSDGGGRGGGGRSDGGRGGGRGDGGGRFSSAPPPITGSTTVLTNIVCATLTPNFQFYMYTFHTEDRDGKPITSKTRCSQLLRIGILDRLWKNMPASEKESRQRTIFFDGTTYFFSASPVPGIETFPMDLLDGADTEMDRITLLQMQIYAAPVELSNGKPGASSSPNTLSMDFRCADCVKSFTDFQGLKMHCQVTGHKPVSSKNTTESTPSPIGTFSQFANLAIKKAMGERMARWGPHFIDPKSFVTPRKRNGQDLGVHVFQAYEVEFNVGKASSDGPAKLMMTVDLKAKVIRTRSLLDILCNDRDPKTYRFSEQEKNAAKRRWVGQGVISKLDKSTYWIHDILFDHSPDSLPVGNLGMSHTAYFRDRKKHTLQHPAAKPMLAVLGRNKSIIHFPAEIVCVNDLDEEVKMQLPQIASFNPEVRSGALETIKKFLIPGAQSTKNAGGLLPALGIVLDDQRLKVPAEVMPIPVLVSHGMRLSIPAGKNQWTPQLARASFDVDPKKALVFSAVVIHHKSIGWEQPYKTIVSMVNNHKAIFRLPDRPIKVICAENDKERHWGCVETNFSSSQKLPPNVFVLDFSKPSSSTDVAYPVVKKMFATGGILSQFVNFRNYNHDQPSDPKRSGIILSGVARQILNKAGVAIWWTEVPKSLPLPAVFIGVDVYHAPRKYDVKSKSAVSKASVAAVVIRIIRDHNTRSKMEYYTQTFKRASGQEYDLGKPIQQTLSNALKALKVPNPKSCIYWRDGVGDTAIANTSEQEIKGLRSALGASVPIAMVVCQKRISTKFFSSNASGGVGGMPAGTLVQACGDLNYPTYYINGTAPPYATPKPVRFLVAQRDPGLASTSLVDVTWGQMCDYPNWAGSIKVPVVCQLAHLLAEHAGNFDDAGESINHSKFANHLYFL